MTDALVDMVCGAGVDLSDVLIFLPSRRAVRTVEKALAMRAGAAIILPTLVPLGEGFDDNDFDDDADAVDVISDMQRIVVLTHLLAADASVGNIVTALPVARDLMRMVDYLENEGVNAADINWSELVDEKYATHFQRKANLLNILSVVMGQFGAGRITQTQKRNADIRAWMGVLDKYKLVIVCGSTASVPATSDLMAAVAGYVNGRIILSGKIVGNASDFELKTNPYNSEYKFLGKIGVDVNDIVQIDVGPSAVDFMNVTFGNLVGRPDNGDAVRHCHMIECKRESEEAAAVAEIVARSVENKKTVLVITPDAAGNQRIAAEFENRGIVADFSGGVSGAMSGAGRAILNLFDAWMDMGDASPFDKLYAAAGNNLFEMLVRLVDGGAAFSPNLDINDVATVPVFDALRKLSECIAAAGIGLTLADARAFVADAIGGVSVRGAMNDGADVVVLGTIESRMQTADVVILTGLNEGMFPARGYENAWLPNALAEQIGLPSPDRKVALQALDFMNLSCGGEVFWTRSLTAGGVQTTQSRFLSRVMVRGGQYDTSVGDDILRAVRARDNLPLRPLSYLPPTPPADWSDVYVTELELLIHNPYAFYVRHILRLRVLDDYWLPPDARQFGTLVHNVIENARDLRPDILVAQMDARARDILGDDGGVLFHFWHRRFLEIAPVIATELSNMQNTYAEIGGSVNIAGRTIRARADSVWDGGVMDIKTGTAPNKSQLTAGNMPQLPLEAYMLQTGGFPIPTTALSQTPVLKFLQLKLGDVRPIVYDGDVAADMINAAVEKVTGLVNMYSAGGASYEYHETGDRKYKVYDDLARKYD